MLDNIIDSKASRDDILEYITSILIDVNDHIVLYYYNKLSPIDISTKTSSDDL